MQRVSAQSQRSHYPVILIADVDPVVHDVMAALARYMFGNVQVLLAASYEGAISIAREHRNLDLALLDIGLPGCPGTEAFTELRQLSPKARVLVLAEECPPNLHELMRTGAAGLITKGALRVMSLALQLVMAGGSYVPMEAFVHGSLPSGEHGDSAIPVFTQRQIEVLKLLLQGLSNSAIAAHLNISEGTVKQHIHAIFTALRVSSRTQAVAAAMKLGLHAKGRRSVVLVDHRG